jgi:hypothetical protein
MLCTCPLGSEITDIFIDTCPEEVGQIQKILVQRVFSAAGVKNSLTIASANPNVLATWTPLLAASNSTKVVQTPFLTNPVVEPGAPRTFGGGNATLGGVEIIVGREPTQFTAAFLSASQRTIKDLKEIMCETIGVYLIDEYGRIIGISNDIANPTIFYPIPVHGFFVGDKKLGGLEEPDMNMIQFSFYPNWSDNLHIVTPTNFDALTALVTP